MGVSIEQWRSKIGCFNPRLKCGTISDKGIVISRYYNGLSLSFRLATCIAAILITCGDVESNPGPPKTDAAKKGASQSPAPDANMKGKDGVTTRQRTLHSFSQSPSHHDTTRNQNMDTQAKSTQVPVCNHGNNDDMFSFLRLMREDLVGMNKKVMDDLNQVQLKMDTMMTSVNDLKNDNEMLKKENQQLHAQLNNIQTRLDQVEGQSRRNNLRFNGIDGNIREPWDVTENKLRTYLKDELKMENTAEIEIDRAHRVKSRDNNKCTIIARFSRYKDTQQILESARASRLGHSVQPDYTDRVKRHRRLLGDRMIYERSLNNYASIRYDKLFINDGIYKYDDSTESIVQIGTRPTQRRNHGIYRRQEPRDHNQFNQPIDNEDLLHSYTDNVDD